MTKIKNSIKEALSVVKSGDTLLVGGFGLVGSPLSLIEGLINSDVDNLTVVSNNLGEQNRGLGKLLNQGKIKKGIGSYFTSNRDVGEAYKKGIIELELSPQGTLAERMRAGGVGIPAFYTQTAQGTDLGKGKEERCFNGDKYILETALRGNVALIRAHKADTLGNLVYYKTARNFNPIMATAADYVIAEVDEIVEAGELDPECIVTPHLYVDTIVKATHILTKEGVVYNG
ncbi:CoA transferase subunit A [Proteiniborus sp. MB09-C3]|uniref:CoA transferase subunit A n=1 Tax=Proteiniborus sp. MB09-C3 TaxID=3050072 RepID=UPI002555C8DD|nr:CoA transferase subunit A [Proteiniborus sp. MB09-C3]WIV12289.1 CoA transferase subunit A [Proteiniborus sp. MB09-C3]